MNLLEAKNLIYSYYKDNNIIIFPDNLLEVLSSNGLAISDTPELDTAILKKALTSFEEIGFVKQLEFSEDKTKKSNKIAYVLDRPLQTYPQTLELNGETCYFLADLLNSVRDKDSKTLSNPLSITPTDIEELLLVTSALIKKYKDGLEEGEVEE